MALIAGAGNPTGGSNPAGTSQGLNYIGEWSYANSGFIDFNGTAVTLLSFQTGSGFIIADIQPMRSDTLGQDSAHQIFIDEQLVGSIPTNHGTLPPGGLPNRFLLPSYSKIEIKAENTSDNATLNGAVSITGRVYY